MNEMIMESRVKVIEFLFRASLPLAGVSLIALIFLMTLVDKRKIVGLSSIGFLSSTLVWLTVGFGSLFLLAAAPSHVGEAITTEVVTNIKALRKFLEGTATLGMFVTFAAIASVGWIRSLVVGLTTTALTFFALVATIYAGILMSRIWS